MIGSWCFKVRAHLRRQLGVAGSRIKLVVGTRPGLELRADSGRAGMGLACRQGAVAAELLEHTDRDDPVFGAGLARVLNATRPLQRAAQESGEVRTDLTLEQILDMVAAIAKIPGDAGYREPILRAALDALRPAKDDRSRLGYCDRLAALHNVRSCARRSQSQPGRPSLLRCAQLAWFDTAVIGLGSALGLSLYAARPGRSQPRPVHCPNRGGNRMPGLTAIRPGSAGRAGRLQGEMAGRDVLEPE